PALPHGIGQSRISLGSIGSHDWRSESPLDKLRLSPALPEPAMATLLSIGFRRPALAAFSLCLALTASAGASPVEPVRSLAAEGKAPLIESLKGLVAIESGSGDREGLDKIADVIAGRLKALGGAVEMIEPDPADIYRMVDTPKQIGKMVQARFVGAGTKKIL